MVVMDNGVEEKVITSQTEEPLNGKGDNCCGKYLKLNSINSPQVMAIKNVYTFELRDGTVLRKMR